MLIRGFVRIPAAQVKNVKANGANTGLPLYLSPTAGHVEFDMPSGSDEVVRVVGHCIDDHSGDILMYFNPDASGSMVGRED